MQGFRLQGCPGDCRVPGSSTFSLKRDNGFNFYNFELFYISIYFFLLFNYSRVFAIVALVILYYLVAFCIASLLVTVPYCWPSSYCLPPVLGTTIIVVIFLTLLLTLI